jgi:hypothetical protein
MANQLRGPVAGGTATQHPTLDAMDDRRQPEQVEGDIKIEAGNAITAATWFLIQ